MISRRSTHPDHRHGRLSHFDYFPPNNLMPPSFGQASEYETSLESTEFFQNMFNMPGQSMLPAGRNLPALQPLSISQDVSIPPHQLISPLSSVASGSSGPSSPHSAPYTPTTNGLTDGSCHLNPSIFPQFPFMCISQPQTQEEAELQAEMMEQNMYSNYTSWEDTSLWPTDAEVLLGDDFDLNAIPPIELGLPKYCEDTSMVVTPTIAEPLEFGTDFAHSLEGYGGDRLDDMLQFDEMMAGHGF